ncbi:hypothetical protein [Eikenella corrodens]|uniref:Uncharacterized protein n=1 Tax=Eikenella corrodens TaxID=539 RepID=A0A3S9SIX0_EIKCO|nr:hypothetical protein [Eikenella corrodens]AZR59483.1 hypothetical protein ELB75_05245 [Eikenella corrodens]
MVGPILLFLGSIKWAEPWYYWLLLLLDPGSITTLLDLPAILKLIWDGSFVNRTATYRSPQHTLRLYRNGSFELEYEPSKAELAACTGEIDCGCSGDWRREADKLYLFHGGASLSLLRHRPSKRAGIPAGRSPRSALPSARRAPLPPLTRNHHCHLNHLSAAPLGLPENHRQKMAESLPHLPQAP